ncbi:FAD-dependent oxidoreductase [Streptomyces sp. NPDC048385]|uniref:dihydrolipoyl dehydrogenase family protein n=1 Tax=unclassified Streptomyces TaxID=2593676 RepID=UPI0034355FA5
MREGYDLVVVGAGSAGLTGARTAARLGARVLLVERARMGGDCLWTGCVPSKALLHTAAVVAAARRTGDYGLKTDPGPADLALVMARVRAAITAIEPHDSPQALTPFGIDTLFGQARFTGPRTIEVDGRPIAFRFALIATGSAPALPPIEGLTGAKPLTSDTVWDLSELPGRLAVLGGGAIGCELGQAFARLGAKVTIVEMTDQLLPQEESDAARLLRSRLEADGLRVLTGVAAERVEPGVLHTGSGPVPFDRLLVTTGRTPHTTDLGLAEAGVETTARGHAGVNARLRTSNPRIYAAGDVTELSAFTHLAGVQAAAAVTDALLGVHRPIDYRAVPAVTFTDPEVARVGLTHARARERYGGRARIRTLRHDRVDRAVSDGRTDGFTTLVLGPRDKIVGATVVAPRAGETIAHLATAVRLGWTASTYAATVHPYPTYADGPWNTAIAEATDRLGTSALLRRTIAGLLAVRRRTRP